MMTGERSLPETVAPGQAAPIAKIRPAQAGEGQSLGALGAELVSQHHEFDPRRFLSAGPTTAKAYGEFLERQLGVPDVLVLVAVQAGMLIGYAFAGLEGADYMALRGPAGVVYDLIIAAPFRGQGLGARLLTEAIDTLRARGAPRIILSTAAPNHAAQRLFSRFGFRPTMIEMTLDDPATEQAKHARL